MVALFRPLSPLICRLISVSAQACQIDAVFGNSVRYSAHRAYSAVPIVPISARKGAGKAVDPQRKVRTNDAVGVLRLTTCLT